MRKYVLAAAMAAIVGFGLYAAATPVPGTYAESVIVNGVPPPDGVSVEVDPIWNAEKSQYASTNWVLSQNFLGTSWVADVDAKGFDLSNLGATDVSNLTVHASFLPGTTKSADLGSLDNMWAELYALTAKVTEVSTTNLSGALASTQDDLAVTVRAGNNTNVAGDAQGGNLYLQAGDAENIVGAVIPRGGNVVIEAGNAFQPIGYAGVIPGSIFLRAGSNNAPTPVQPTLFGKVYWLGTLLPENTNSYLGWTNCYVPRAYISELFVESNSITIGNQDFTSTDVSDWNNLRDTSVPGLQVDILENASDIVNLQKNQSILSFRQAAIGTLSAENFVDGITDFYTDEGSVQTNLSTNATYDAANDLYCNQMNGSYDVSDRLLVWIPMDDDAANTNIAETVGTIGMVINTWVSDTELLATNDAISISAIDNGAQAGSNERIWAFSNGWDDARGPWLNPADSNWAHCIWWKNVRSDTAGYILGIGGAGGGNNSGIQFTINGASTVRLFIREDESVGSSSISDTSITGVSDTNWHFAVVQRTSASVFELWLDGAIYKGYTNVSMDLIDNRYTGGGHESKTFTLGSGLAWQSVADSTHFDGIMDNYQYYAGSLTASEIAGLYNNGDGRTNTVFVGTASDLVLTSTNFGSNLGTPDTSRLMILKEDVADTVVLNTDLVARVSRDNGVTWNDVTLQFDAEYDGGIDAVSGTSTVTNQPSDTNMLYRIESKNNKAVRIHGTSQFWD
jgi:hypothetical protein